MTDEPKTAADIWLASADHWREKWRVADTERYRLQHRLEDAEKRHEREMERLQRHCSDLRDLLRVALEHTDLPLCGECRGSGKVRDEEMVGGRTWMQSREIVVECRECDGLGRVL